MKACLQWINSSVPEKINYFRCYNRMRNLHRLLSSVRVWYCHRPLLSVFYFYYSLSVSLSGLFTCLFFACIYHVLVINLRLWYKGAPKYLGESVTGSKFRLWKTWQGSCVVEESRQQGCQCSCRQIPVIPLHMHSAFPTEMGEQMILTSFGDVIITLLVHLGIGYKRKVCKSLRAVVCISGTEQLGQLLGGHWPSTSAISVLLVEKEYIPVELCALFIHVNVPRLVWDTLS